MSSTGRRRPGRPPAAKADETRKRILRAARLVFSERGYEGATFQAIAVRADLTRPAINHYFSSKRVLYREALAQTAELIFGAGIAQADRETTLLPRLTGFIAAAVAVNREYPSASAFLMGSILETQRHPELNQAENDAVLICRGFLTRVVNEAIEADEIDPAIDAGALIETLLVVMCGAGFYSGFVHSYPEFQPITEMLGLLLDGALSRSKD
ncbi:TetR/AcrR family transcriptional regulator [Mycobacterium shigaense]|uniref:TetR/AcrR family transcriptional regulator n=1 Tax=Mycobacterium shigaense TaxID=722731 RepID=UPI000BBB675B|nr:TetR/AcrR family transcriptional regulator [Mycobacterium shigaense]MEA1124173.1 helix-turn-helix domain-containing protein [Mycobacterium shigaense]PRI17274.1 TetR family transcriptional regulator [Mycobacterium shigaense]